MTSFAFLACAREDSALTGDLPKESDQFRFLSGTCHGLDNLKVLICWFDFRQTSVMRVTIPLDLSTRPWIPLPPFFHSRRTPPLLTLSLVLFPHLSLVLFPQHFLNDLPKWHMMCSFFKFGFTFHHSPSVTFFSLTLVFFYSNVVKSSLCDTWFGLDMMVIYQQERRQELSHKVSHFLWVRFDCSRDEVSQWLSHHSSATSLPTPSTPILLQVRSRWSSAADNTLDNTSTPGKVSVPVAPLSLIQRLKRVRWTLH